MQSPNVTGVKGKRVKGKTHRLDTAYCDIKPRGSRQQQRKRKADNASTKADYGERRRKATRLAERSRCSNYRAINCAIDEGCIDQSIRYDWDFAAAIDPTHVITKVHPKGDAIYCKRCGYYNNGGPLRRLKKPCTQSIPKHMASLHKMLTNGIVPKGQVQHEDTIISQALTDQTHNGAPSSSIELSQGLGVERSPPREGKTHSSGREILPN